MNELAVVLLLAAMVAPSSAPVAVRTHAPVSAQSAAAPARTESAAMPGREVREPRSGDRRNDVARPDQKGPAIAQAPAAK
jgi:hypothetical protein